MTVTTPRHPSQLSFEELAQLQRRGRLARAEAFQEMISSLGGWLPGTSAKTHRPEGPYLA